VYVSFAVRLNSKQPQKGERGEIESRAFGVNGQ
jgi:hypothetical protein